MASKVCALIVLMAATAEVNSIPILSTAPQQAQPILESQGAPQNISTTLEKRGFTHEILWIVAAVERACDRNEPPCPNPCHSVAQCYADKKNKPYDDMNPGFPRRRPKHHQLVQWHPANRPQLADWPPNHNHDGLWPVTENQENGEYGKPLRPHPESAGEILGPRTPGAEMHLTERATPALPTYPPFQPTGRIPKPPFKPTAPWPRLLGDSIEASRCNVGDCCAYVSFDKCPKNSHITPPELRGRLPDPDINEEAWN